VNDKRTTFQVELKEEMKIILQVKCDKFEG
jgi:hypothetical protein